MDKVKLASPWKTGDRILIEAIVESVFDGKSNWPVKILLDTGFSETVDCSRNVHYSAIHQWSDSQEVTRAALECARQAIEYSIDMGGPDPGGVLLQALNKCDQALSTAHLAKVSPHGG